MTAIAGAPPAAQTRAGQGNAANYLNVDYGLRSWLLTGRQQQSAMLHDPTPAQIAGVGSPAGEGGAR